MEHIKSAYENMSWEDYRDNAGDLNEREIEIYDTVVIEGVPAPLHEVEKLKEAMMYACEMHNIGESRKGFERLCEALKLSTEDFEEDAKNEQNKEWEIAGAYYGNKTKVDDLAEAEKLYKEWVDGVHDYSDEISDRLKVCTSGKHVLVYRDLNSRGRRKSE